ncbi:MAG TPA: hypothetical protein VKD72_38235, partial [Gemmataceae bacterium]|nr:hypothetical protein [Gemmataceae bacterium]
LPLVTPPRTAVNPGRYRGQQKLALATALAAGLLVFAAAFWALQLKKAETPAKPQPIDIAVRMEQLLRPYKQLPPTATTQDRMQTLAYVAGTVHKESYTMARESNTDDLRALAGWYRAIVLDEMVEQAKRLPDKDRLSLVELIASGLEGFYKETEEVAKEVPEASASILHQMAELARDTGKRLRDLT